MAVRFSYDAKQGGWVYDMHGGSPSIQNVVLAHGGSVFPRGGGRQTHVYEVPGIDGYGLPGRQAAVYLVRGRDSFGTPYMQTWEMTGDRAPITPYDIVPAHSNVWERAR